MKLFLLLLPVCASAFVLPGNKTVDKGKDLLQNRFGKLTEDEQAKLAETWGIDVQARKDRLDRISKKAAASLKEKMTPQSEFKERLKDIVPIAITKPNRDAVPDLFEVNNIAGISDYLFEGDIHLTEIQLDALENERSKNNRKKRQAYTFSNKWTGNTLYFYFDRSINQRKKNSVQAAQDYLTAHTCINFVESSTARNRVKVYNGNGCSSAIGMSGGEQLLSLGTNCEVVGTVAHEFAHALGFLHTQSRSDRNTFVDVDLYDVDQDKWGNFEQMSPDQNELYTPYEYGGFLHYSATSFVNNRNSFSILPMDPNYTYTMGNRQMSFYDMQMINFHYCNGSCTSENSPACQNGGYPNPRNCAICNCPRGYGGNLCNERPAGCGQTLVATSNWQQYQVTVGDDTDNENTKDVFTTCTEWITAPEGKQIQVRILEVFNDQCNYGCPFNGIEIKADANQNITNPLYCCAEFYNRIITSNLNPTPIIAFNRYYISTFDIEYRYVDASNTTSPTRPPVGPTTRPRTDVTTTTTTASPTTTCNNQLLVSPVISLYNSRLAKDHYHSNVTVLNNWLSQGYRQNGQTGRVVLPDLCQQTLENLQLFCPTAVKLRAFISGTPGVEYMTAEEDVAQNLIDNGWQEIETVGYCSTTRACGTTGNLRSVTARDGGNIVYSIDDTELNDLNTSPRYRGTLSATICWMF